jgi:hypothetical protein
MSAHDIYKGCKKKKEELEELLETDPKRETKTGEFRFSDQSPVINIFTTTDVGLLQAILKFLSTIDKMYRGINKQAWVNDINDRIERLTASDKLKHFEKCMEESQMLMKEDERLKVLEEKYKI